MLLLPAPQMDYDKVAKRIEKDKAKFVGCEIEGKTLGVVGLGAIGGRVVNAALALGMKVVGYDPVLSLDAAWKLPGDRMARAESLEDLLKVRGGRERLWGWRGERSEGRGTWNGVWSLVCWTWDRRGLVRQREGKAQPTGDGGRVDSHESSYSNYLIASQ